MKEFKVYLLKDSEDNIVYVGQTSRPLEQRFRAHTKFRPIHRNGNGKFYGRDDISIELFDTYKTKEDALHVEGVLKQHLGFEWTEKTTRIKNGKKCGSTGKGAEKTKELYSQPVLVYTTTGKFVNEYYSQREAARELTKLLGCKMDVGGISNCVNGNRKAYKGYVFNRKI